MKKQILTIAAILLGCDRAVGCDIDENAPPVVMENAALNGIGSDRLTAFAGDVLVESSVARRLKDEKFEVVTANIVADAILKLSPVIPQFLQPDGVYIVSGIIEERGAEVEAGLAACGFVMKERLTHGGWCCFVCGKG